MTSTESDEVSVFRITDMTDDSHKPVGGSLVSRHSELLVLFSVIFYSPHVLKQFIILALQEV